MRDQDYTASSDFLKRFFGETLHKVELRACSNDRSQGANSVFGRDDAAFERFCRKEDVDGKGVYFGLCTRGDVKNDKGSISGGKDNVLECTALWVDIDCAKQGISGEKAINELQNLPHPPTLIINSGGGLHAYWMLEEIQNVSPDEHSTLVVEACLRQLAHILAGDMLCAEVARILRLPGTMNSKAATRAINDGEPAPCEILYDTGTVHDFDTLRLWLGTQRVVLQGKAEAPRPVKEDNPFAEHARNAGYEPSIDIDVELASMVHGSAGRNSIHDVQLRVSMSMVARGYEEDEIVARILAATEAAAPGDEKWNWASEERAIRKMISTGRGKVEQRKERGPSPQPMSSGNAALKLVHDADADADEESKAESTPPKPEKGQPEKASVTVAVGKAVIGVWQDRHGPVMHTDGKTYAYDAGVWLEWNERLAQRLRAIIQEACGALKIEPKTAILNAAKAYFMDRPEMVQESIVFDEHGLLVADDACLNLATFEIIPHSPQHYAIRKAAAPLAGDRSHAELDAFLDSAFSDRPEAPEIIATLQEWFGAAIMPLPVKHRGQKKGLFAHGPSRCSKTQISELARFLLGHRSVCGAAMSGLEDRFGTEPLIGKYGWIADDAVSEGEFLNPDIFKVVVTGEQTSTKTKGGKNWEGRFGIPVMLTANNLFRVKDQSDAVYNRLLILPMTNVRPENAPEPAGYESIADKIGKTELTGLLWWAIEGWQRLAARGMFDPPAIMLEASKALKDDNNPVGTWMRECVELCPDGKVLRSDLLASMNGWSAQEFGADARPWSGRGFFPKLTKMMPGYSKETSEAADVDGNRLMIGVKLTQAGLLAWRVHKDSRFGQTSHTSESETFVNKDHAPGRMQAAPPKNDRRPRF